jgi:hypothetical protein
MVVELLGKALEWRGFAVAYAGWRLRLELRSCFLEGVGVLEEVGQGIEAFAGAEDERGREVGVDFV